MRSLGSLSRVRATIAAAVILVLLTGVGFVATAAGRGALAASTTNPAAADTVETGGITRLVNPDSVLSPPTAAKLVDGSAIEPIDSTPYKIMLGGVPRYFRIHFPNDVAPRTPRPLILVLPGWRRTARDAEREYGFDQVSDTADVTVAYVDGVHNSWDAGTCCGFASSSKLDDVGGLHVLVDTLASLVRVDRRHVILAGFSNGAMLAYRTACSESAQLAGMIIASGSLQVADCRPGPLSLVVSHGERDATLPIKGENYSSYLRGPVTSLTASLAPFEKADACTTTALRRTGRYDVGRLSGCSTGVSVTTYVDVLGGHAWLGQVPVPGVVGGLSFADAAWQLLAGRTSVVPFSP